MKVDFCACISQVDSASQSEFFVLGVVPMGRSKMALITQLVRGVSLNEHVFGNARKVTLFCLRHYITLL